MSRKRQLSRTSAALACAAAFSLSAAHAADFDGAVFLGDSLTDAGTFGARFTTNPGATWAELLAARIGTTATPFFTDGGSNFAVGGARVTLLPGVPNSPPTDTAPPVADQLNAFLASRGGAANARALYSVWAGANDVFVATSLGGGAPAYLAQSAGELAALVERLQAAGARYIIVPNLPDIGATPFGVSQGPAGGAALTQLSASYNAELYTALAARGVRVIAMDTFTLLREVMADPAAYGFSNVTVPACGATPSLVCTPADLVAPDAARTFLYADGVHPTSAGHALMADYAASILAAPGQISMLAETALKSRITHVERLYLRAPQALSATPGQAIWVALDAQRVTLGSGGLASDAKGNGAGVTIGAEFVRAPSWVLGAALGLSRLEPDFGNGGSFEQEEAVASVYGAWASGPWRAQAALSYGVLAHETNREIRLGTAVRSARGSPGGSNLSLGVEGGYRFSAGGLSHGPVAGVLLQRAAVDGFLEDGAGSASLRFAKQERESGIAHLGWTFDYAGGWIRPYARVTLERELRDDDREVEAQLATAPQLPNFALPAISPGRTSATLAAGASVALRDGWSGNLGFAHSDAANARITGAFVAVSRAF